MSYTPTPSELEFLRELKEGIGYKEMGVNLELILDIAAFESKGSTDERVKEQMDVVKQLIRSLREL